MAEDIRELRDKILALTAAVESRKAKYRLVEMEERLTDLLENADADRAHESPQHS